MGPPLVPLLRDTRLAPPLPAGPCRRVTWPAAERGGRRAGTWTGIVQRWRSDVWTVVPGNNIKRVEASLWGRGRSQQTRWYQNHCSTFTIERFFFDKKTLLEILTPGDLNFDLSQKWPIWYPNDFPRTFERRLSYLSTTTGSRDHGGVQTHPPPSPQQAVENPEAQQFAG